MTYGRPIAQNGIKLFASLPNKSLYFTACSNYCVSTGNVAGRWQTIYNAIDFSNYHLTKNISPEAPLMFLGRLDKIKGVHTAIRVANETGNKLWIGGNVSHTADNYSYFKKEIEPLIDQQQIVYLGPLSDEQKNKYLGQAKALLFPIEWDEPFGMVMIEAMACGTPVIAFNRGAVPEVVNEGVSGFVVHDRDSMISALKRIASTGREACRHVAEKRFDVSVISQHYLDLVNESA